MLRDVTPSEILLSSIDVHETERYEFMDFNHLRYAPKFTAVVAAWEAITKTTPKKIVKQTLEKYLIVNAAQYKLVDEKDNLKTGLIGQLASVAN
ncbi:hypothetical protein [Bartonella sp. B17]